MLESLDGGYESSRMADLNFEVSRNHATKDSNFITSSLCCVADQCPRSGIRDCFATELIRHTLTTKRLKYVVV